MELSFEELSDFLEKKSTQYNNPNFIETDPISIPHRYSSKQDIEIAGFLTSVISWGQRKTILSNAQKLLLWMDDAPYQFLTQAEERDFKVFQKFVHRTFGGDDCTYFVKRLQEIYDENIDLEEYFLKFVDANDENKIMMAISRFKADFMKKETPTGTLKHLPDPSKNSAAKRFNMMLRWFCRKDNNGVDFGIWSKISTQDLMIPLDLHSGKTARSLGLLQRKQDDRQSVELLTKKLREFDPIDPVKYDFALYGYGVFGD